MALSPAPQKKPGTKGAARRPAKSTGKSAGKKTRAQKKRGARGKKNANARLRIVLMAFAAGLALASFGFWLWGGGLQSNLPGQDGAGREPSSIRKREPQIRQDAPRQEALPQESSRQGAKQQSALPKVETGNRTPTRDPSNAVEIALMDLHKMAYEEPPAQTPLEERIRQVDYALMQAGWLHRLPAKAMRLTGAVERQADGEKYRFQRVEILPGSREEPFLDRLRDCLALWGDGASLKSDGPHIWSIQVQGVRTHTLILYPGQSEFPKASAGTSFDRPPPSVATLPWADAPRLRSGGEEPKLVIVIDDLGANDAALRKLLALDFPVTCAFWPHGAHTRTGARAAHAAGREVLVHQPMEPIGYPKVKPGPNVLLAGMNEARIRSILNDSIAAVPYAVGLNNHMGSKFTQQPDGVRAVIRLLKERGLFMLDSLTHKNSVFAAQGRQLGIENYKRNVFLDVVHSRDAVMAELRRAERIALFTGQAVAIGHPLPETVAALKEWQGLRNKKVRIVRLRDLEQAR